MKDEASQGASIAVRFTSGDSLESFAWKGISIRQHYRTRGWIDAVCAGRYARRVKVLPMTVSV